jgi:hypothetical protein
LGGSVDANVQGFIGESAASYCGEPTGCPRGDRALAPSANTLRPYRCPPDGYALRPFDFGRPFPKGVSGNPGGRPKGLARYVRELVGDDGKRIADFMAGVLDDEVERTETRIQAAMWLADRGFGKAPVTVDGERGPAEGARLVWPVPVDLLTGGLLVRVQPGE